MVPETPGWYWVSRGRSSHLVFVYQMPGLPCEVREPFGGRDGTQWRTVKDCAEALGWVWGERIPDSPTLKAMREYFARDEWTMGCGQCPDCYGGGSAFEDHPCYPKREHLGHMPGCPRGMFLEALGAQVRWRTEAPPGYEDERPPWLRRQEKQGEHTD